MSIQLQGNNDSVFSNDVIAPNLPTQGQIVGYQQGVWFPGLTIRNEDTGEYSNLSGVTYRDDYQSGWYSRVGNLVTFGGTIRLSNKGTPANTDRIRIGMLPYKQVFVQKPDASTIVEFGVARSSISSHYPSAGLTSVWNGKLFQLHMSNAYGDTNNTSESSRAVQRTSMNMTLWNPETKVGVDVTAVDITNSFYISAFTGSFLTDDTTWTPINGATIS